MPMATVTIRRWFLWVSVVALIIALVLPNIFSTLALVESRAAEARGAVANCETGNDTIRSLVDLVAFATRNIDDPLPEVQDPAVRELIAKGRADGLELRDHVAQLRVRNCASLK